MITEFILNVLCFVPIQLLNSMTSLSLAIPSGIFDGLNSVLSCLGFLFPIKGLLTILGIAFAIKFFQIIWAIILRIKSFIPTMGN